MVEEVRLFALSATGSMEEAYFKLCKAQQQFLYLGMIGSDVVCENRKELNIFSVPGVLWYNGGRSVISMFSRAVESCGEPGELY